MKHAQGDHMASSFRFRSAVDLHIICGVLALWYSILMASLLDGHVTFIGCRFTVLLLQYAHTIVLVMFS
ncbi:uncharacterized protein B0J16DRAFT_344282 [Fusarium flagelliforme]|uniref:uncharacterized protein n=1 Tax=Fusarium flagelliforme TaxID=2675880 RepID=UPI001E8DF867|nr:uncharacterized protein B0J16DRAFT_344282 [Fusarium flagelliforme]KAH7182742.1 hypothetical protein B0J16DRAFT_344282 [Fusarium flagelliforme]